MKLSTVLGGRTFQFRTLKEVLAKANEEKSGDVLAGIAAESDLERVAAKLVLLPLIFIPIAVWMGFSHMELLCLLILFSSPSPVTASIMARNTPGADWQLAGQIVVFSTIFSVVSLFCILYTLLSLGLL